MPALPCSIAYRPLSTSTEGIGKVRLVPGAPPYPEPFTPQTAPAVLEDLLAMELSAITKRKQLRDYDDLRAIEQIAGRRAEEGLALAARRYRLRDTASFVVFETALGRVGECGPDPLVVTPRQELNSYWVRRAAEVVAGSSRWDVPVLDDDQAEALFGPLPEGRDGTSGEV